MIDIRYQGYVCTCLKLMQDVTKTRAGHVGDVRKMHPKCTRDRSLQAQNLG